MAWFKVDDGFATSVPVLQIPRRYRASAVGLWVLAGTWSAKELTDGYVPRYVVNEVAASTEAIAKHLVSVGLWDVCSDRDGFMFVGWAKYQFTKEQVCARRAEEAERKKKAREAKSKLSDQRNSDDVRNVSHEDNVRSPGDVRAESALPDQTRPDQTRSHLKVVTSGGNLTLVDAPEPPRQCQSHINDPTPPRCGFCADARKINAEWTAQHKSHREQVKANHRQSVDACGMCDGNGMVEAVGGLVRCNHQEVAHA
jgi:hypothetical protein